MKKQIIHDITILSILSLIIFSLTACADQAYGNIRYYIKNGEVTICGHSHSIAGEIVIPDKINGYPVTTIGVNAFSDCSNITSVSIPSSVTKIEACAFQSCTELCSIIIPGSVTYIGTQAFNSCARLSSVVLPFGITHIDDGAFRYCENMTTVTISNSVHCIGNSAFSFCKNLISVVIQPGCTASIGEDAFSYCENLSSIILADSITSIGRNAFSHTAYHLDDSNYEDGVLYIGNHLIDISSSFSTGDYIVKSGTTCIADCAFFTCHNLTSVQLPQSVTHVGYRAFAGCLNLSSFSVSKDNPNLTSVDGILFDKSQRTLILYPGGKSDSSYKIPKGVTKIDAAAFFQCPYLTSITIPDSIKYIEKDAFLSCVSLQNVYYTGTDAKWDAISISEDTNDILLKAKGL